MIPINTLMKVQPIRRGLSVQSARRCRPPSGLPLPEDCLTTCSPDSVPSSRCVYLGSNGGRCQRARRGAVHSGLYRVALRANVRRPAFLHVPNPPGPLTGRQAAGYCHRAVSLPLVVGRTPFYLDRPVVSPFKSRRPARSIRDGARRPGALDRVPGAEGVCGLLAVGYHYPRRIRGHARVPVAVFH